MADGTLYIVPLERFELRSRVKLHRGTEWLCCDSFEGKPCMQAAGQNVFSICLYVEGERALDFFSGKELGSVISSERGTVLAIGRIRAILTDVKRDYSCRATPQQVKAELETLRPYKAEIIAEFRARCEAVEALALQEEAEAAESKEPADQPNKKKKSKKENKGKKSGKKSGKRKRVILILLVLAVLVFAGMKLVKSFNASCGSHVKWRFAEESSLLIVSGSGASWDYPMGPLKLDTPWNRSGCGDEISAMIIDEGITEIGTGLFSNTTVESVTIPYSVTTIKEDAFKGCSRLTSVTIPKGVTTIGADAFCTGGDEDHVLTIYYAGTAAEWVALLNGTVIDSEGVYQWVKCSDMWVFQSAEYGIYGKTGDDEWTKLD